MDHVKLSKREIKERLHKVRAIAALIAARDGIEAEEVMSRNRTQLVSRSRFLAYAVADRLGYPRIQIARAMLRDHATIIYGCRRVNERRKLAREADMLAANLTRLRP
jgi:chromosomal replication initiation ATPase DnaA